MSKPVVTGSALARALFAPRSVALIGASSDPRKNTGRPQRFLKQHGYRGAVYPINPGRDEVQGVAAFKSLEDVPEPVDHALIMVTRDQVPAALLDCGARGVPVATIYSDGFADLGTEDGISRQRELVQLAREAGVRVVGPNSMGVFSFENGFTLSVNAILEMPSIEAGHIAVISQSGSILGSLLSRGSARGFGFSKMISVGNEADLGVGEILELLIDDPDTHSIALFLESLRGADALALAARRAHKRSKPVVAYKLGRSDLGRQLAATHSGAMTGDDAVADAFFQAHGIARVEQFETLLEVLPLLAAGAASRRGRVSVMTTTGGGAATVVDRLGEAGIETVPASESLAASLAAQGIEVAGKAITDLTMAGARREIFESTLAGMLADERSDAVVVVVGSSGQFHPQITVQPIVACAQRETPLAVYIVPDAPQSLRLLADAGVAAFRTPEGCADAVRTLLAWQPPQPDLSVDTDPSTLAGVCELLQAAGVGTMNEARCYPVLQALGIEVAPFAVIDGQACEVSLSFPVALKLLSNRITHKSDVGGVEIGIPNAAALRERLQSVKMRLDATGVCDQVDGYLVQSMQRGVAEAVVAFRRDPEVGPLVSVGLGGALTEIYRDIAVHIAPVSLPQARAMIADVKGLATIRGYRSAPPGDVEALARCIVAMSTLAHTDIACVREAEINPVIVRAPGDGVVAVDAVMVLEPES